VLSNFSLGLNFHTTIKFEKLFLLRYFFVPILSLETSVYGGFLSRLCKLKSTVPAFTIIIQACFLGKAFSRLTYLSLFPIVGGVVLASFTEINFDTVGFLAALIASVITALLAVVSGMLLTTTLDAINLLYYMAPTSTLVVLPFVFLNELEGILSWPYFGTFYGFLVLLISGLIAFGLNITTFLVIKHTSPLTYTVAGNFKIVLSISISVLIFRNTITILNGVGCLIAVAGVWWYNNIRQQEKLKEKLSETRKQGM